MDACLIIERMDVKNEDLPDQFQNVIVENSDSIKIRSNLKSITDINFWVTEFGRKTNTNWNTRDSCPSGERFICWKKFVCHHSSFKKVSSSLDKKTRLSKNSNCLASLQIKVKVDTYNSRRNDKFIKEGLLAVIIITPFHSHTINTAETLRFLPAVDCKEKFLKYFDDGMGITESSKYHKEILQMEDNFKEADMANSRINPTLRTIRYWYDQWRELQNRSVSSKAKHQIACLALDEKAPPLSLYQPVLLEFEHATDISKAMINEDNNPQSVEYLKLETQTPDLDGPSVKTNNDLFEKIIKVQEDLHNKFGSSSSGLQKLYSKLNKISSEGQWEEFLHTSCSRIPLRYRASASIHVQPTSIARRSLRITRRSKNLPSRRPASGVSIKRKEAIPYQLT